jgi:2-dehydro-3-deoxyglucarate aldolase/4-hydroxy-2-oxoheptanedioate aldolase
MSLKEKFANGTNVVSAWLSIGHPAVAEVTAAHGFDFVLIDTEHTAMSLETVENMSRGVGATEGDTETVVRVPSNDAVRIKRVLDIGVSGVMVPMVETAAEARDVVEATRYPPTGIRGVASGRASEYGDDFQEYVETANNSIVTVVQIENSRGINNAADIAATDGIDAVFVGPADLSANFGVFAEWQNERLNEAIERVIDAGDTTGVPVGTIVIDPADIEMRVEQGFDYLIVGKDTSHLASANEAVRERYERALDETNPPTTND